MKSDKAELEWLESVDNFLALPMATHSMNNEHQGYDNLTWVILFNKYNTAQDDNIPYREWQFDSEIANPPLLNLQTETVDPRSSASFPRLVALSSGGFIFALKPHQPTDLT